MGFTVRGETADELEELGLGVRRGKELELTNVEAAYVLEKKIKGLEELEFGGVEKKIGLAEKERDKYEVFRYFRKRGRIARDTEGLGDYLFLWRKGKRRGRDLAEALVKVIGKDACWKDIEEGVERARALRKKSYFALVEGGKVRIFKIGEII